jgi:EAL and modified HD-GYP domain-containing signal transduction protein
MSAPELSPFPLVELQAVSNAHNEWVALTFDVSADSGDAFQAALTLLKTPDLLAARGAAGLHRAAGSPAR